MLEKLEELRPFIGKTPLAKLAYERASLYCKLEYNNFSGSSKDRAAYSIISNAIKAGKINDGTTIIASSSGNLAIAIATLCKKIKIKFIPVIDPNINPDYERLLNLISHRVVKVGARDSTGGFLLTRIQTVNDLCATIKNSYCADQYGDPNNFKGYYELADEIMGTNKKLDLVFVAVSSGGAITGVSIRIKEKLPRVTIVGVDVEGSVIFGQSPEKRYISGIGSSLVPPILQYAKIDEVAFVSQANIIKGCYELLNEQAIFAGASSGAVYFAAKNYFNTQTPTGKSAVLIFPDKGTAYLDTVYNKDWERSILQKIPETA
jgi:N-(2-amino-2-carboxyethyl)-L-glutamate synthase